MGAEAQPAALPHAMHYFPGITLKFCVSDIGLQALQMGCKLLRRITMNKISNHSPAQVFHILPSENQGLENHLENKTKFYMQIVPDLYLSNFL